MERLTRLARSHKQLSDPRLWVEAFVIFNFVGLALDIYLAHSTNEFRRQSEYIPLYLALAAPIILLTGFIAKERFGYAAVWRDLGYLVGWAAIVVGITGVILHLDSRFFYERTIKSLTYAAPFAAPLAYTGLGLLLLLNRMVVAGSVAWAYWVLFLALGGFVGNFVFSLTDHATNGFFRPLEWLPVISSAFAVSFLLVPFFVHVGRRFFDLCALILFVEAGTGLLGFLLHWVADLGDPSPSLFQNVVHGAPPFAPLLFPNLVLLALIPVWILRKSLTKDQILPPPF